MTIIQFKDVWEMYRIKFTEGGKASWENFWALKAINFEVRKGEILGVIGENGAGKSTLLKVIAGMLAPDRGEARITGRVSGLLELGAGFQPELTGRENIYLNAGLFGLTQQEIDAKFQEIVDFASLGKFIHAPVKCYSQGMFVRLAFAIAIHVGPDILLIDDTLAVGDEFFQKRCIQKIFEIKEQGKTIIFVTHDMAMLRRLCNRVLFLKEGRIVKDDSVDKVVPLRAQTIGERQGVGVLEKKSLGLIFNNGRLFMNWQDKPLTQDSAVHTVFRIADQWHSSLEAEWEIKEEDEKRIVARGTFHRLGLTQIWNLELEDDTTVKWDIEMIFREPLEIQEGFVNAMLVPEYSHWFSTLEKGKFPQIDENDKNWQPLLKGYVSRRCVGATAQEAPRQGIPALAFQLSNPSDQAHAQIFNTDFLLNSRVLQYKVLQIAEAPHSFLYFSGKIVLGVHDIDHYLESLEEEFTLSDGHTRFIFNNGEGMIFSGESCLTKGRHLGTSIYSGGKWYVSHSAHWEVKKKAKNQLIARGRWPGLPLEQIWDIVMKNPSSLLMTVSLQLNRQTQIEQQRVELMASENYRYWYSDYGKGNFPSGFLEDKIDMVQRCIGNGAIGVCGHDPNGLPCLSLEFSKNLYPVRSPAARGATSNGVNNFFKIFNSDFFNKARILQAEKVEPEAETKFLPGTYESFQLELKLECDPPKAMTENSGGALRGERLKFVFEQGRGRIYWDEMELTKKLGLYTSVRSKGRWHDSVSSALWKIDAVKSDVIRATGQWSCVPMEEHWEIRLKEENAIEFNVILIVHREIEVDRLQTNLMVLEKYSSWSAGKEKGSFPDFKANIDDDWECVYDARDRNPIGVSDGADHDLLPRIRLFLCGDKTDQRLHIVNSDLCHRGRLLQCLDNRNIKFPPGEYPYFSGQIVIEP